MIFPIYTHWTSYLRRNNFTIRPIFCRRSWAWQHGNIPAQKSHSTSSRGNYKGISVTVTQKLLLSHFSTVFIILLPRLLSLHSPLCPGCHFWYLRTSYCWLWDFTLFHPCQGEAELKRCWPEKVEYVHSEKATVFCWPRAVNAGCYLKYLSFWGHFPHEITYEIIER